MHACQHFVPLTSIIPVATTSVITPVLTTPIPSPTPVLAVGIFAGRILFGPGPIFVVAAGFGFGRFRVRRAGWVGVGRVKTSPCHGFVAQRQKAALLGEQHNAPIGCCHIAAPSQRPTAHSASMSVGFVGAGEPPRRQRSRASTARAQLGRRHIWVKEYAPLRLRGDLSIRMPSTGLARRQPATGIAANLLSVVGVSLPSFSFSASWPLSCGPFSSLVLVLRRSSPLPEEARQRATPAMSNDVPSNNKAVFARSSGESHHRHHIHRRTRHRYS